MSWINDYLTVPYVDGGRGMHGFDCWGLVRDVLHRQFNTPLLESFGHVCPDDKPLLTDSYLQVVPDFLPGPCKPGAVACGFHGDCLIHVGIVINNGQTQVLHTGRQYGKPLLTSPRAFRRLFQRCEYFHYECDSKNLSQQA
ncbi:NlpC/P60 family protein [Microbulbifer sp. JMSA008]|uniref:NlpC/P60 family protein n=1 Tax=Microbulbifer sp. JMSA008 TaxID=3243373 RepID=UPI00403A308A